MMNLNIAYQSFASDLWRIVGIRERNVHVENKFCPNVQAVTRSDDAVELHYVLWIWKYDFNAWCGWHF